MSGSRTLKLGLAVLVLSAVRCETVRSASLSNFIDFSLPNPAGGTALVPGRLYAPPEAASGPRPFILFLHGAGESGVNNTLQVNGNIDNLLAEAKRRGAYLYAPQTNNAWGNATTNARVMSMVDKALAELNVDGGRLYVTGLSMGGGGTWNFLNSYKSRWAAGVPICGVSPATGFAPASLLDMPIWAFHARDDATVGVATSRTVFNSLLAANGEPPPTYLTNSRLDRVDSFFKSASRDIQYTEYWSGGHGIWPRVYNTPAMYDWLFSHSIPEPNGAALALVAAATLSSSTRRSPLKAR
jgi:predicted peptidase